MRRMFTGVYRYMISNSKWQVCMGTKHLTPWLISHVSQAWEMLTLYWNLFPMVHLSSRQHWFRWRRTETKKALFNTLRPRQNGRHFPDDIFKCIFLNENAWILIKILLKFVPKGPINKIPTLVQIMAWRRSGDKPLSEPMMVSLLTHICVARPQWVNRGIYMR